jgi:hypothetical protein
VLLLGRLRDALERLNPGVPQSVHDALMAAQSHGRYFIGHIRGAFPYRQVR